MDNTLQKEFDVRARITKEVDEYFVGDTKPDGEYDVPSFYQHFNEMDFGFSFDWYGNIEDNLEGSAEAVYYSDAIKRTVILNHDVPYIFTDKGELIMFLMNVWRDMDTLESKLAVGIK